MIIKGKAVFKCPKTGEEVSLSKDCVECECFKYWMWENAHPLLACSYPERYRKDVEQGGENVKLEEEKDKEEEEEGEEEEEEFE
jgi:hypothetical protein